jgi:hypothetical protein
MTYSFFFLLDIEVRNSQSRAITPHRIREITRDSLRGRGVPIIVALICTTVLAALAVDGLAQPGDLYVTNLATNTIDVYSPEGVKSTFATGLNSPQGLAFDEAHNLYVADGGTGTIFKYDTAGNRTTLYTGLSAPLGLTVNGHRLLVVEGGLERALSLRLDGSGGAETIFAGRESIVEVQVARTTYFVTWDTQLEWDRLTVGGAIFFNAAPRGLTVTQRRIGANDFDVYVATDNGNIWAVRIAQTRIHQEIFVSGLNDPWGVALSPRGLGDGRELYVADRAAGEIFKYTSDGVQSVFASDAGIPNFLAFETD